MADTTHRASIVFVRDDCQTTVVAYMSISIGLLVDPTDAAIQALEELAARYGTTLADCEKYSLLPVEKVSAEQRAADARMLATKTHSPRLKPNPYR